MSFVNGVFIDFVNDVFVEFANYDEIDNYHDPANLEKEAEETWKKVISTHRTLNMLIRLYEIEPTESISKQIEETKKWLSTIESTYQECLKLQELSAARGVNQKMTLFLEATDE